MACHPDLVLRSKNNQGKFLADDDGEAVVCRLCNDVVEDAIKAKCNHVFDRECIKQYLNTAVEQTASRHAVFEIWVLTEFSACMSCVSLAIDHRSRGARARD
jgi:predicted metal-binding protein